MECQSIVFVLYEHNCGCVFDISLLEIPLNKHDISVFPRNMLEQGKAEIVNTIPTPSTVEKLVNSPKLLLHEPVWTALGVLARSLFSGTKINSFVGTTVADVVGKVVCMYLRKKK